jgi:hypothetical protein
MSAPLIPHNWQLPDYFRGRLGKSIGRQRMMQFEDQLLLITHYIPKVDEHKRQGQLFWRNAEGKWLCSNGQPGPVALEKLITGYEKMLEEFEESSDQVKGSKDYLTILESVGPIVRGARGLYETLQHAREALPAAREIIDWRDQIEEVVHGLDLLFADVKTAMDVALIRQSEQQSAITQRVELSAYRLNILAALCFPLATLGSVLGTTLTDGWSWSKTGGPFGVFLMAGVIGGLILVTYVTWFRRDSHGAGTKV